MLEYQRKRRDAARVYLDVIRLAVHLDKRLASGR